LIFTEIWQGDLSFLTSADMLPDVRNIYVTHLGKDKSYSAETKLFTKKYNLFSEKPVWNRKSDGEQAG